jgi:predicted dehydrogenase
VDYYHQFAPGWKTNTATAGSAWMMGGIHGVDLLLHFMGYDSALDDVYCVSQPARWRKDFEYPTSCCAIVRFADGRIGKLATNAESNMPYVFSLHLNGTKGSIRQAGYYTDSMPAKKLIRQDGLYPDDWNVAEHPFAEEVSFFVDCIESKTDSPLCFARAAKCYHLIFAMDASAAAGKPVKFARN